LNEWTHIILDEVHERDEDMDFVMLLCKKLIHSNSRGVKIILMSATMNEQKFCEYFPTKINNQPEPAPSIILPNRKKNNTVQEFNLESFKNFFQPGVDFPEFDINDAKLDFFCIHACRSFIENLDIREAYLDRGASPEAGAVLVFLPGLSEIHTVHDWLREANSSRKGTELEPLWWILPLHSSIPVQEHKLIFNKAPVGQRKIILSTNIAESSITVPDIVYVIDFCLTKNIQADEETNYPRLVLEWASRQQCVQRMGRAGRVQKGTVYRLVDTSFCDQLKEEHEPELKRAPLSKVVLDVKLLEFGSPKELLSLAMDPPNATKLHDTILTLKEIGALLTTVNNQPSIDDGDITVLGKIIANLPVDVRIGKLIVFGHIFNVLEDAIIIAAGLNGKSVFTAPFERKIQAYKNKLWWADRTFSDCFAILLAFKTWAQKHRRGDFKVGSQNEQRRREQHFCDEAFLQKRVLHEMKLQIDEIQRNLEHMNIKPQQMQDEGGESQEDRFLILRFIMFGAFYPNYFKRPENSEIEELANKIKNPKTCVYMTGFPTDQLQYGALYENQFKRIFAEAAYQNETDIASIEVEGNREGNKVIVEFARPVNEGDMILSKKGLAGEIIPPVYVATKMRRGGARGKMMINLYTEEEAYRRHKHWKITVKESCDLGLSAEHVDQVHPPDLNVTCCMFTVQHITDPNTFWIHLIDVQDQEESLQVIIGRWIQHLSPPRTRECSDLLDSGSVILAPHCELYYRARILSIDHNRIVGGERIAMVFFIDYGNVEKVNIENLRVIDKRLIKNDPDIVRIPGLALECSLSHIQPNKLSSGNGLWSKRSIEEFRNHLEDSNPIKYGSIFSVTKASSGRTNCHVSLESLELVFKGQKIEMKNYLLQRKFAERATESFQSEKDAKNRANFSTYDEVMQQHLNNDYKGMYNIEKPKMKVVEDKRLQTVKCQLRGPYSPLEYEVMCAYRQGSKMQANVDSESVNSVLLDENPSDPHEQWMVAAHVGISSSGETLLLRNTTWLPAVPGLGALFTMIFAPQVELRTNYPYRNKLSGFVAGLGPKNIPSTNQEPMWGYFSKHDIEVKFDVEVGMDDITLINKLRYWMNQVLSKSEDGVYGLMKPTTLLQAQNGIMQHLKTLLNKKRDFVAKQALPPGQEHRWNLLKREHRMPSQLALQGNYILKMIDGVDLEKIREEEVKSIREVLVAQNNLQGKGLEPFPIPFLCPCCFVNKGGLRVKLWSSIEVFVHNKSQTHMRAEAQYLLSQEILMEG